jgi:hypothetical protein
MTLLHAHEAELAALRKLEQAVRACGLPAVMVSGQKQIDMLSAALREVVEARTANEKCDCG